MTAIIVAIIGGISSLIGIAIKEVINAKADRQKAEQDRDKQYNDIISRLDRIEENTAKSIGEIRDELNNLRLELMELKDESRENDAKMKRALMNLARSTLNKDFKYFYNLGRIDDESYQTFLYVYESYKELGGNTFVDEEMEKLKQLKRI